MNDFELIGGELHAENVPLSAIAEAVGTPLYVYSTAALQKRARSYKAGVAKIDGPTHVAFAVKANPNLAVIRVLANEGFGADVVSGGEMTRAMAGGIAAKDIVFSGVGKTRAELAQGLDAGIGQFNLELEEEGFVLAEIAAAKGLRAPAVLRVNPDVDAGTHDKISTGRKENKFGLPIDQAPAIFDRLAPLEGLNLRGVAVHIGSQLSSLAPLEAAFKRVGALVAELRANGHSITHVDLGGGLGVPYRAGEVMPSPEEFGEMVARVTAGWDVELQFEPGRAICANAGLLVTEVLWVKPGVGDPYVIVDAAMNDLARVALYDAHHDISAVRPSGETFTANVAGPVCESSDVFAKGRAIDKVESGELLVLHSAGAYGATMASMYNSRPLVPEVLVSGDKFAVVAKRVSAEAIMGEEQIPDWI